MFSTGSAGFAVNVCQAAIGGKNCHADTAELFFFDNEGRLFEPCNTSVLSDRDPLTNYSAEGNILKEFVDFGNPVMVDKIGYVRRGDGNAIIPGDSYEIY